MKLQSSRVRIAVSFNLHFLLKFEDEREGEKRRLSDFELLSSGARRLDRVLCSVIISLRSIYRHSS